MSDTGYSPDFVAPPWWTTVSGAGTTSGTLQSWASDYTKSRSGLDPKYTTTDAKYGRVKTGRELDKGKWN
jgi:hypothetical protein